MEEPKSVAPKGEAVLRLLDERADIFRRRGTVSEIWRVYRGQRVGPFYELRYREGPRQRRACLGRCAELADEVRRRLAEMQAARREQRQWDLLCQRQRAHQRQLRATLNRELEPLGLRLQGYELRGTRQAGLPKAASRVKTQGRGLAASCLLPPAPCLLPPASCLLPPASCLLPPAS